MKLQTKLFVILALVFFGACCWVIARDYRTAENDAKSDVRREARNIRALLMATRRTYHKQFIESGIPLNDDTIGFLPAHAMSRISEDMRNWTDDGLTFNNVSDRPRNPDNQADEIAMEAIEFFRNNPNVEERFVPFKTDDGEPFFHYSRPIWTEAYCLKCHGNREDAPEAIQANYSSAFGYKEGDLRGVMSIRLPGGLVHKRANNAIIRNGWSHILTFILAFGFVYWAVIRVSVRRLDLLSRKVRSLANGNRHCPTKITGKDEIASLFADFDKMAQKLEQRELDVANSMHRERQTSKELESMVENLNRSRQAADNANRAKSEFLANMSHEIRTPMTAILGFSDILLESNTNPEQEDAAVTIKQNGEYLIGIINDILDLSKIESGMLDVEKISCSPAQVLSDVTILMSVRAKAKGLNLEVEYDGPIPSMIKSDPTRLRQILINLVGNAIKFTEVGSVRIVTRLCDANGSEPNLQFEVIDTGIGMTEEQASHLFKPFQQADSSTTRKFGGTGLGLAISKRLAEALGGGITVRSEPGKGAAFTVSISTGPLHDVELLSNHEESHSTHNDKASPENDANLDCRILLAEDGPDNQRLLSFLLGRAGAEVTVADNGQIAYDLVLAAKEQGEPVDAIVMDMQMPVLDGYDATRKIRESGFTGPIIALTANAMSTDRRACLDAGCDDYLTKPVDRRKLLSTITEHLAGSLAEAN